mmetsp:Transcript_24810/g.78433  ORF Transcript_24810/g.78433 Transcript_24810/m.78433 type:complete len:627 (+) Transcript_24810:37-1917(+)
MPKRGSTPCVDCGANSSPRWHKRPAGAPRTSHAQEVGDALCNRCYNALEKAPPIGGISKPSNIDARGRWRASLKELNDTNDAEDARLQFRELAPQLPALQVYASTKVDAVNCMLHVLAYSYSESWPNSNANTRARPEHVDLSLVECCMGLPEDQVTAVLAHFTSIIDQRRWPSSSEVGAAAAMETLVQYEFHLAEVNPKMWMLGLQLRREARAAGDKVELRLRAARAAVAARLRVPLTVQGALRRGGPFADEELARLVAAEGELEAEIIDEHHGGADVGEDVALGMRGITHPSLVPLIDRSRTLMNERPLLSLAQIHARLVLGILDLPVLTDDFPVLQLDRATSYVGQGERWSVGGVLDGIVMIPYALHPAHWAEYLSPRGPLAAAGGRIYTALTGHDLDVFPVGGVDFVRPGNRPHKRSRMWTASRFPGAPTNTMLLHTLRVFELTLGDHAEAGDGSPEALLADCLWRLQHDPGMESQFQASTGAAPGPHREPGIPGVTFRTSHEYLKAHTGLDLVRGPLVSDAAQNIPRLPAPRDRWVRVGTAARSGIGSATAASAHVYRGTRDFVFHATTIPSGPRCGQMLTARGEGPQAGLTWVQRICATGLFPVFLRDVQRFIAGGATSGG